MNRVGPSTHPFGLLMESHIVESLIVTADLSHRMQATEYRFFPATYDWSTEIGFPLNHANETKVVSICSI